MAVYSFVPTTAIVIATVALSLSLGSAPTFAAETPAPDGAPVLTIELPAGLTVATLQATGDPVAVRVVGCAAGNAVRFDATLHSEISAQPDGPAIDTPIVLMPAIVVPADGTLIVPLDSVSYWLRVHQPELGSTIVLEADCIAAVPGGTVFVARSSLTIPSGSGVGLETPPTATAPPEAPTVPPVQEVTPVVLDAPAAAGAPVPMLAETGYPDRMGLVLVITFLTLAGSALVVSRRRHAR